MSVLAVIIARMGSTRLPGKVLMKLGGLPTLLWVIAAAQRAYGIDEVIVATTTEPADDAIAERCAYEEVLCYRGAEHDVLARVAAAARTIAGTTVVVRLTADCPFVDPDVIGAVVRLRKMTGAAYASNVSPRTWPDGLDVEAFTTKALFAAEAEATRPIDRECVTTWIQRNRSRFPAAARSALRRRSPRSTDTARASPSASDTVSAAPAAANSAAMRAQLRVSGPCSTAQSSLAASNGL